MMATGMAGVDIGSPALQSVPTLLVLRPGHNLYYVNCTPLLYSFLVFVRAATSATRSMTCFASLNGEIVCATCQMHLCKMHRITSQI
jgi:hypothetical protein